MAEKRRENVVGSILAVTTSDRFVPGQKKRFVGICTQRERTGLRHNFTLRNVVDGMGVEIMYDMYNPLIQKIEVLRLERWLDDYLIYLKDAREEYSTIPFDLHPQPHPPGAPVPVNTTKVVMKPPPWSAKWQNYDLRNVDMDELWKTLTPYGRWKYARARDTPTLSERVEKFDIAYAYRSQIPREDEVFVFEEMEEAEANMEWPDDIPPQRRRPLFPRRRRKAPSD